MAVVTNLTRLNSLLQTDGLKWAAGGDEGMRNALTFKLHCHGCPMRPAGNFGDLPTTITWMPDQHSWAITVPARLIVGGFCGFGVEWGLSDSGEL